MRESQLDKVYNGGFKCHSAGPDISPFDMESEWELWSSQSELISLFGKQQIPASQKEERFGGIWRDNAHSPRFFL